LFVGFFWKKYPQKSETGMGLPIYEMKPNIEKGLGLPIEEIKPLNIDLA